jgi:Domain of unknown function (DUF397)
MAEPNQAVDSPQAGWYKSSLCETDGCVEIAFIDGDVAMRNSNDRRGHALRFSLAEWQAFLGGIRNQEFDLHRS